MTTTRTHTHVLTKLANPYLRCDECGIRARTFVAFEEQVPGCDHWGQTVPCGHLGLTSDCPSWGPVDGCQCQEHLGHVPHEPDWEAAVDTVLKRHGGEGTVRERLDDGNGDRDGD